MTIQDNTQHEKLGHHPVVPPRINAAVPRVPEELLRRFADAWLCDVSDAVGPLYTMDPGIRPLYFPMRRLVGQALTVKAPAGDNLTVHGALGMVSEGDVLVIDWRGSMDGCATGANSVVIPVSKGLRGAVVDGGWRDISDLRAMDFPVCGRGVTAYSPPKERPGEINVPVSCGGVVVSPGDIVVGDEDGVVVVPLAWASQVLEALPTGQPHGDLRAVDSDRFAAVGANVRAQFLRIAESYGAVGGD